MSQCIKHHKKINLSTFKLSYKPGAHFFCRVPEGDLHKKPTGMLVVSFRGRNCEFLPPLEWPGEKANIFPIQISAGVRYVGLCIKK